MKFKHVIDIIKLKLKSLPIMSKILYAATLADTRLTSALQILCTLTNSRSKWKHSA